MKKYTEVLRKCNCQRMEYLSEKGVGVLIFQTDANLNCRLSVGFLSYLAVCDEGSGNIFLNTTNLSTVYPIHAKTLKNHMALLQLLECFVYSKVLSLLQRTVAELSKASLLSKFPISS